MYFSSIICRNFSLACTLQYSEDMIPAEQLAVFVFCEHCKQVEDFLSL